MADLNDFNKPTVADLRTDVQDTLRAHAARAVSLNPGTASNRPIGAKLAELISNVFTLKNWNGTTWDTWLTITNAMRTLLSSATNADARDALSVPSRLQIISQELTAYTTGGSGTAYTLTPAPVIAAYAAGQSFFVTFHAECGASPTLQINGLAAPPVLSKQAEDGSYVPLNAADILANHRSRVTLLSSSVALVETISPPYLLDVTALVKKSNTSGFTMASDPLSVTVPALAAPTFTELRDVGGLFNSSTGVITIKRTGIYKFQARGWSYFTSTLNTLGGSFNVTLSANIATTGSNPGLQTIGPLHSEGTFYPATETGTFLMQLEAGDTATFSFSAQFFNMMGSSVGITPIGGGYPEIFHTFKLSMQQLSR
jgi:hypothetical protein